MHSKEYFISRVKEAVLSYNENMVQDVIHDALNAGIDHVYLVEYGLNAAMDIVGKMFSKGQLFLPHVIAASEAMNAGIRILMPSQEEYVPVNGFRGTIMIGTIEGDIHSIGKDIVAASLRLAGYRVIDLGIDVPVETFTSQAMQLSPDIIATSALMNITMINQQTLEEKLKEIGIRHKVRTMVGGSPVSAEWVRAIGADIYGADATEVVEKVNYLIESGSIKSVFSESGFYPAVLLDL
ncbi:MAG: B12-binding domain-containing protein [Methanolobus sp.]|nr:B12-binding domain-containing protein [Methanolobus sp.]